MTSPIITKSPSKAASYISEGRIIAFPSNTSYGLAVNALDGHALQRLRNLKNRSDEKTFTIFLAPAIQSKYLDLTDTEQRIISKMTNKPLTLLVKPKASLQHLAKKGLIGLRVIDHSLMKKLAIQTMLPLTATSANKTGKPPCSSPQCIIKAFPGLLPDNELNEPDPQGASGTTYDLSLAAILDAGKLPQSQATTIAQLLNTKVKIIRSGAVSKEDLENILP